MGEESKLFERRLGWKEGGMLLAAQREWGASQLIQEQKEEKVLFLGLGEKGDNSPRRSWKWPSLQKELLLEHTKTGSETCKRFLRAWIADKGTRCVVGSITSNSAKRQLDATLNQSLYKDE